MNAFILKKIYERERVNMFLFLVNVPNTAYNIYLYYTFIPT